MFILVSDNDAKPLGGPCPTFKPEKCPTNEEKLFKAWKSISQDATIVFFSEEGSVYQRIANEWNNAYFYPIENLFDFSCNYITDAIKEHTD